MLATRWGDGMLVTSVELRETLRVCCFGGVGRSIGMGGFWRLFLLMLSQVCRKTYEKTIIRAGEAKY